MKMGKPLRLIELLNQLLAETDKMNVGKIYISIIAEMKKITFAEGENNTDSNLIYKHLIQLSIKDFIHSGRSEASSEVVNDVIKVLSKSKIII